MSTETTNKKIKIDNGTTFGRTYTDKAIDERLQGLVSTATFAPVQEKANNSLQKPAGLAKTKLVGVGTNGQENIEIGDNLILTNGKLSATGGKSVPPTLNVYATESGDPMFEYPDLTNVEKGLYIVNVIASYTDPTILASGLGYVDNSDIFGGKTLSLIISLPDPTIYSFIYGNKIIGGSPVLIPNTTIDKSIMIYDMNNNSFITLVPPEHNGFLYYDVNHLDTNNGYSWKGITPSKTISHFITLTNNTSTFYLNYQNTSEDKLNTLDSLKTALAGKSLLCTGHTDSDTAEYISGEGGNIVVGVVDNSDKSTSDIDIDSSFTITDLVSPVE